MFRRTGDLRKKPFHRLEVPLITEVEKQSQMKGNDTIGDTPIFTLTIMGGRVIMCNTLGGIPHPRCQ